MVAEGTSYDFAWTRNSTNGANLAVWCGSAFNAGLNLYPSGTQGTPVGRKRGGSGVSDCYYPTGMTTYAACDGSAHTLDLRDGVWGDRTTLANGDVVAKHMWVN